MKVEYKLRSKIHQNWYHTCVVQCIPGFDRKLSKHQISHSETLRDVTPKAILARNNPRMGRDSDW